MAAQVAAAAGEGAAQRLLLSSEEEAADGGPLGLLDLTTREVSLAGLEKEIESCGESEVLRAILDQGAGLRAAPSGREPVPAAGRAPASCCLCSLRHLGAALCMPLMWVLRSAGVDPREYSRQYEAKLRQAEVASIQVRHARRRVLGRVSAAASGCACSLF